MILEENILAKYSNDVKGMMCNLCATALAVNDKQAGKMFQIMGIIADKILPELINDCTIEITISKPVSE